MHVRAIQSNTEQCSQKVKILHSQFNSPKLCMSPQSWLACNHLWEEVDEMSWSFFKNLDPPCKWNVLAIMSLLLQIKIQGNCTLEGNISLITRIGTWHFWDFPFPPSSSEALKHPTPLLFSAPFLLLNARGVPQKKYSQRMPFYENFLLSPKFWITTNYHSMKPWNACQHVHCTCILRVEFWILRRLMHHSWPLRVKNEVGRIGSEKSSRTCHLAMHEFEECHPW